MTSESTAHAVTHELLNRRLVATVYNRHGNPLINARHAAMRRALHDAIEAA